MSCAADIRAALHVVPPCAADIRVRVRRVGVAEGVYPPARRRLRGAPPNTRASFSCGTIPARTTTKHRQKAALARMSKRQGPTPALNDKTRALALAELRRGRTPEEVADDLRAAGIKCSARTLRNYAAADRQHAGESHEAEPSAAAVRLARRPPPAEPTPIDENEELAQLTRRLLADCRERIREAQANGDGIASAREARVAGDFAKLLARLEKVKADGADVITITRAEAAEASERLREKVRATLSRGQCRCPGCARLLSAELGGITVPTSD